MRKPGCAFSITFLIFLIVIIPVSFLWLILESKPSTSGSKGATVEDAVLVRSLVKRSHRALRRNKEEAWLSFTENDLNSLMVFMARGINQSSGNVEVSTSGVRAELSFKIPDNPIGKYVNIRVGILPSDTNLRMSYIAVGRLRIPGTIVMFAGPLLLDTILGQDLGTLAFGAIKTVQIRGKKVFLKIRPLPDLKERLFEAQRRMGTVRDSVSHVGDPLVVREYYAKLIEIDTNFRGIKSISLSRYISPLFQMAKERGGDPAEENQAAVLALSMFLGSRRIESFVGPFKTVNMKKYRLKNRKVSLAGRKDLRLHFLVSAGLTIITQSGITHAVGEFKELMDAGWKGGSGFSFADLAADRAGVHFAQMAINIDSAKKFQETFSRNVQEHDFFPSINTLPEGITKLEFDNYYGNVEGEQYLNLVGAINKCIVSSLPAYSHTEETVPPSQDLCDFSGVVP